MSVGFAVPLVVGWCENALDPEMEVKQRNYIREFSEEKIQASPTVLRESFWLISMSRHFNRNRNWGKLQQVLVLSTFLYLEAITLTESAHHPAPLPDKWTHELPIWGFSKAKWLSIKILHFLEITLNLSLCNRLQQEGVEEQKALAINIYGN